MNRQSHVQLTDPQLIDTVPAGQERAYLPGMGKHWLMPFYDILTSFAGVRRQHRRLIEVAELAPGQRLLDVGCGTGNLLQAIARTTPGLELAGLDPDRTALDRAARKLRRSRAHPTTKTTLFRGYADRLPYDDGNLDRVVSSLALHHLQASERDGFAAEAFRTLRPGGILTVLDFDGSHSTNGHRHASHEHGPRPGPDDDLLKLFGSAGFTDVSQVDREDGRMGPMSYLRATRP